MSAAPTRPADRLLRFLLAAGAAASLAASALAPARAHDAGPTPARPLGWHYPFSCCADYDCRTATRGEVLERPEGYVIANTGEVVPVNITGAPIGPGSMRAGRSACSCRHAPFEMRASFEMRARKIEPSRVAPMEACEARSMIFRTGRSGPQTT